MKIKTTILLSTEINLNRLEKIKSCPSFSKAVSSLTFVMALDQELQIWLSMVSVVIDFENNSFFHRRIMLRLVETSLSQIVQGLIYNKVRDVNTCKRAPNQDTAALTLTQVRVNKLTKVNAMSIRSGRRQRSRTCDLFAFGDAMIA